MGGVFLVFLVVNIGLFCCIFWLLTWAGELFLKKKIHRATKNFIECGFKSSINKFLQVRADFILFILFLILYDIEFIFIAPLYFNIAFTSIAEYFVISVSIFFVILSLSVDLQLNALKWKV